MLPEPTLTHRREGGHDIPLLVWRLPTPAYAISSATLGGGMGECHWLINATVPMSYNRDDPAAHLTEMATALSLTGRGVGLLTGVDVADVVTAPAAGPPEAGPPEAGPPEVGPPEAGPPAAGPLEAGVPDAGMPEATAQGGGVQLWATVGLGAPIQASDPRAVTAAPYAGTINVVAWVPQRLSAGALVNAVATITEAKTQAIRDLGLPATGTATDAVCVLCPPAGPEAPYGGPRSRWGAPLARATYESVLRGGRTNLAGAQSWSDRQPTPR